ncbi:hypothetical protein B0H14DRAFT_2737382 [Mycena olivaceomarginata]|nr:hypothetical protein B0H14DRAFT_2737382 [Mycena olivaceomarginata]
MNKERTREGRGRNGREEDGKRNREGGKERKEKEEKEETDAMRTSHRRIERPTHTPRQPATRPSTLVRDARMPARRGALARPGRRAAAGIALCCTCSPLPLPLPRNPSSSVGVPGASTRGSRPGDLLARLAARAALLVCLHVGVPQMGSGGAPRDVRSADVLELRRPCVKRRAREEVVHAVHVLCATALARALYPGGGVCTWGEHAAHRPRRHTPRAPREIKPEVGV